MSKRHWSNPYLDKLVKARGMQRLAGFGLWPNAKELTESVACAEGVYRHTKWDREDGEVTVLVVGDGRAPRTGGLIATETKWMVHSCDPLMKRKGEHPRIERCVMHRKKAETLALRYKGPLVVVAPHSHANLTHVLRGLHVELGKILLVSLPCCVPDGLGEPARTYEDGHCLSPKRRVNVYGQIRVRAGRYK